jgi:uncharacterized membrane protein
LEFDMRVKEQFARVWLITLLVTYLPYFLTLAIAGDMSALQQIALFAATVTVQIVVIGIASAVMAVRRKGERVSDERDLAIDQRATRVAYQILLCGMILVGCLMPFNRSGWTIFHAAVLSIAVAEIVRHGLIVSLYRRGWDA